MADSDIQEQIDIFMKKLEKSKVPKKAAGEVIVSKKPEKVKPSKKGAGAPVFWDIGITGFTPTDKNDLFFGKLLTLEGLVKAAVIPAYADEMSPSLQLMAKAFNETKWTAKMTAEVKQGEEAPISLFQACVQLGKKLDEWGQSKDWEKIKKHMLDKEELIKAESEILAKPKKKFKLMQTGKSYAPADQETVLESKKTSDEAIIAYLQELPAGMSYPDKEKLILKKFPLLYLTPHLTMLINTHCKDEEVIDKAIKDGEEWVPKEAEPGSIPFSAEENAVYYSQFLKGLVEVMTTLEAVVSTDGTLIPEQPISLYKVKGELLAFKPGPEEEEKLGVLILTTPVKIVSPGDNKVAVPPTFISMPPGVVSITQFIWTIPIDVPADTACQVAVGYGADTFVMKGTVDSLSEALPFKLDKGGVLKVSLQTTMPLEAWLELELKIEAPPAAFMMKLGQVLSSEPLPIPQQTAPAKEELKEPETDDHKLKTAMVEVDEAQMELLDNYEKLETLLESKFPGVVAVKDSVQQVIAAQKKQQALNKKAIMKQASMKQNPTSPLGSINLKTGETVPADHPALGKKGNDKPKGYKPEITAVNVNGKAVDAKELADALRGHLKKTGFTHYTIFGLDHEYKKTKGILMHIKITWAGDPELNLIKWALTGIQGKLNPQAISIHDKKGISVSLLDTLVWLAAGIKSK